jgi:hypothetical protein
VIRHLRNFCSHRPYRPNAGVAKLSQALRSRLHAHCHPGRKRAFLSTGSYDLGFSHSNFLDLCLRFGDRFYKNACIPCLCVTSRSPCRSFLTWFGSPSRLRAEVFSLSRPCFSLDTPLGLRSSFGSPALEHFVRRLGYGWGSRL